MRTSSSGSASMRATRHDPARVVNQTERRSASQDYRVGCGDVVVTGDELARAVVAAIETRPEALADAVRTRRWAENEWLQKEMAERLSIGRPSRIVQRERPYPTTQERCDIWVKDHGDRESWLELKCCVTNYVRGSTDATTNRPITQQINEIIRDIEKLKSLSSDKDRRVVFLAYPLPQNYESHIHWQRHLARLGSTGAKVHEVASSAADSRPKGAFIVVYECRV